MTKEEKQYYKDLRTEAYWSAWGGVEVKKIEYGLEDYAIVVAGTMCGKPTVHRLKINVGPNGDAYIRLNGHYFMFSECILNS